MSMYLSHDVARLAKTSLAPFSNIKKESLAGEVETVSVLDVPIGVLTMQGAVGLVNRWIAEGGPTRLVTFSNVHMIVEAWLRPELQKVLRRMDLNCPDGTPVFWMVRRLKGARAAKIPGPEFMPAFCEQSVALGHRHFLYGGDEGVAAEVKLALEQRYPGICIVGYLTPPFRDLTSDEMSDTLAQINASRADVVWICLGCPKQEHWMHAAAGRLEAKVALAVGQTFDLLAGRTERAPAVLRDHGGEWLFRLAKEPRRLWKRYLVTNLLFLMLVLRDRLRQVDLADTRTGRS